MRYLLITPIRCHCKYIPKNCTDMSLLENVKRENVNCVQQVTLSPKWYASEMIQGIFLLDMISKVVCKFRSHLIHLPYLEYPVPYQNINNASKLCSDVGRGGGDFWKPKKDNWKQVFKSPHPKALEMENTMKGGWNMELSLGYRWLASWRGLKRPNFIVILESNIEHKFDFI